MGTSLWRLYNQKSHPYDTATPLIFMMSQMIFPLDMDSHLDTHSLLGPVTPESSFPRKTSQHLPMVSCMLKVSPAP